MHINGYKRYNSFKIKSLRLNTKSYIIFYKFLKNLLYLYLLYLFIVH